MKQENKYSHDLLSVDPILLEGIEKYNRHNIHPCPSCGYMSLQGMPGGNDAVCNNCGFKEPCCGD